MRSPDLLPEVTIVIEWDNAIDVKDEWLSRAMTALERDLRETGPRMAQKPRLHYLYDDRQIEPEVIRSVLATAAPKLAEVANLELVPAPGLRYYELQNFGVSRVTTELAIILDSDVAPEPGWLAAMLEPFADPQVVAVGGMTVMATTDIISRTVALTWIFGLREEVEETARKPGIYANNLAVRSDFFRANPFPAIAAFKHQCALWLHDILSRGHRYVRAPHAITIHAPHPGLGFLAWRAWKSGEDHDFRAAQKSPRRGKRIKSAAKTFRRKVGRSWKRIWTKGDLVGLPVWQRPASSVIALTFYSISFAAQLRGALTRTHEPLPASYRGKPARIDYAAPVATPATTKREAQVR